MSPVFLRTVPSTVRENEQHQCHGAALPLLLQPIVLRLHLILNSMVYVEVLADKTLLLSHELTAVPELRMNSRALILSPKLF